MTPDLESAARAAYNAWAKLNYDSLCCAIDREMMALADALAIAQAGRGEPGKTYWDFVKERMSHGQDGIGARHSAFFDRLGILSGGDVEAAFRRLEHREPVTPGGDEP